jgi:8-oxo-dGTP pyrophosphatase MutT (NUDIX family)
MSPAGPAADRNAPYARLAVVALIRRTDEGAAVDGSQAGRRDDPEVAAYRSRWLLLHRTQPFEAWDPPGGRVEAGEDLVQAVKREVEEEAGLAVDVAGPCYAFLTFYKGERLLAVSMACSPAGDPDGIRLEPDGTDGWRWATGAEWEDLAVGRLTSWALKDVKKATGAVAAVWEAEGA